MGVSMLQSKPLAAGFQTSLVMPFTGPSEAGLKQIVARKRPESIRRLPLGTHSPPHRRPEIPVPMTRSLY